MKPLLSYILHTTYRILPIILLSTFYLLLATPAQGAGIVPCEGLACTWCHLIELGDKIVDFLMKTAIPIVTIFFIIGGFYIMFAGSSTNNYAKGMDIIKSSAVGLIILMTAWAIINLLFELLAGGSAANISPWNIVQCSP